MKPRCWRCDKAEKPELHTLNIELKNPNLVGKTLQRIEELQGEGVVISRILHKNAVMVAKPDITVDLGDVLLAVGPKQELSDLRLIVGDESKLDLARCPAASPPGRCWSPNAAPLASPLTNWIFPAGSA